MPCFIKKKCAAYSGHATTADATRQRCGQVPMPEDEHPREAGAPAPVGDIGDDNIASRSAMGPSPLQDKKNPALFERGRELCAALWDSPGSTNGDLARLDRLHLGKMDRKQPLLHGSVYFAPVDARIEIEYTAILASPSLTIDSLPELTPGREVPANDQFPVLDSNFDTLLVYPGHLHLERIPIGILMKVHEGSEILHALRQLASVFSC